MPPAREGVRLADSYRLLAGIVIFIIFVGTATFMLSDSFPDIAPSGIPNPSQIEQASKTPIFATTSCNSGDWGCAITNFFAGLGNTLVTGGLLFASIGGLFISLLTFQIPALQANAFTKLVNLMITVPLVVGIGLFLFRGIKGLIPTVGGDVD